MSIGICAGQHRHDWTGLDCSTHTRPSRGEERRGEEKAQCAWQTIADTCRERTRKRERERERERERCKRRRHPAIERRLSAAAFLGMETRGIRATHFAYTHTHTHTHTLSHTLSPALRLPRAIDKHIHPLPFYHRRRRHRRPPVKMQPYENARTHVPHSYT